MKATFPSLIAIVLTMFLTGCEGEMQGVIQGASQRPKIEYTQGVDSDQLKIMMPDGELFAGKLVFANRSMTFSNAFVGGVSAFGIGSASDGKLVGKLFSNRGRVMNCLMQYADASGFTTSGGIGECQVVDGPKIDVIW